MSSSGCSLSWYCCISAQICSRRIQNRAEAYRPSKEGRGGQDGGGQQQWGGTGVGVRQCSVKEVRGRQTAQPPIHATDSAPQTVPHRPCSVKEVRGRQTAQHPIHETDRPPARRPACRTAGQVCQQGGAGRTCLHCLWLRWRSKNFIRSPDLGCTLRSQKASRSSAGTGCICGWQKGTMRAEEVGTTQRQQWTCHPQQPTEHPPTQPPAHPHTHPPGRGAAD